MDIYRLAESAIRGDADACTVIVEQCGRPVFSVVRRMVHNLQDAEELTQDALMLGLQQIDRYDPCLSSLSAWFCRIGYRTALNHLRKSSSSSLSLDDAAVLSEHASEAQMMLFFQEPDDSLVEQLRDAVGQLSASDQRLVTWFYYDGWSLSEIAYITRSSPNALSVRLYRIRQKLYNMLKHLPR